MADVTPRSPTAVLTAEQAAALDTLAALADAGEFRVALLHGVTGSGKTEIYLRLAERVCARGPAGAADGPGDRADAVGGGALPGGVRHARGHPAQRASPTASATISGSASAAATSTS